MKKNANTQPPDKGRLFPPKKGKIQMTFWIEHEYWVELRKVAYDQRKDLSHLIRDAAQIALDTGSNSPPEWSFTFPVKKRDKIVSFWLEPDQRSDLRQAAYNADQSQSDFVRSAALLELDRTRLAKTE